MKIDLKNRQQLLVVVASVAVALLIADKIILSGLTSAWKSRSEALAKLRSNLEHGRSLLIRERSLRDRWKEMQANTLPSNASTAEQKLLKAFDTWSQDSRVSILSITPQTKRGGDDYVTLEARVEASGNLTGLSRFLYEIEKDPMALKLQSVELTSRDETGQQLALGLQVSGLMLTPRETKQ
jgi:hypothetical protein